MEWGSKKLGVFAGARGLGCSWQWRPLPGVGVGGRHTVSVRGCSVYTSPSSGLMPHLWPGYSWHTEKCKTLGTGAQWLSGTSPHREKADRRPSEVSHQAQGHQRRFSRHALLPLLCLHHSYSTAPVFWDVWPFPTPRRGALGATQETNWKRPQPWRMWLFKAPRGQ